MAKMKAAIATQYGTPDVLQLTEIDEPKPRPGELLVRVHASTVNRTDVANLHASPAISRLFLGLIRPKKAVPGTDFAGVVEAVGQGVRRFQPGDRVFGFDDSGLCSKATYLTISERKAIGLIPDNVSFQDAAASIEGAHYARNFLNKIKLTAGAEVLVNGATGAIGSALIQLLRSYPVQVSAVCGTAQVDLIKSLGIERVFDYQREDFTQQGKTYDVILDAVGKRTFGACKAALKPNGVYSSSELGPGAQNLFFALWTPWFSRQKVIFPVPFSPQESVDLIRQQLADGRFKPLIDRVYPLEEIQAAYEYVGSGQKIGTVLITLP